MDIHQLAIVSQYTTFNQSAGIRQNLYYQRLHDFMEDELYRGRMSEKEYSDYMATIQGHYAEALERGYLDNSFFTFARQIYKYDTVEPERQLSRDHYMQVLAEEEPSPVSTWNKYLAEMAEKLLNVQEPPTELIDKWIEEDIQVGRQISLREFNLDTGRRRRGNPDWYNSPNIENEVTLIENDSQNTNSLAQKVMNNLDIETFELTLKGLPGGTQKHILRRPRRSRR